MGKLSWVGCCLSLGSPEVDSEIRFPVQVVYFGGDSQRHRQGSQIGK